MSHTDSHNLTIAGISKFLEFTGNDGNDPSLPRQLTRDVAWMLSLARGSYRTPREGVAVIKSFRATPARVRIFSNRLISRPRRRIAVGKTTSKVKAETDLVHFLIHSPYNIVRRLFIYRTRFHSLVRSLKHVIFSKLLCPRREANTRKYGRQHCLSSQ